MKKVFVQKIEFQTQLKIEFQLLLVVVVAKWLKISVIPYNLYCCFVLLGIAIKLTTG